VGTNYMAHASATLFWAREVVREYMTTRRYEIYAEERRHRGRAMADVVSSKPLFGAPSTRERSLVGAAPDDGIDGRGGGCECLTVCEMIQCARGGQIIGEDEMRRRCTK